MTSTDAAAGPQPGVLATWRDSPPAARALLAGIFVNRLGSFLQVFLVLFLTHRGFSAVQAGGALAVFTAGAVLGSIIGGTLTDRLGPRRTILLSMTGGAALLLSILYLRNYLALLAVVVLVGTVGGAYRPAASSLLSALTPRNRQVMIFAMYRLAYNLGNTAAPLLAAALISVSYDLLFWGEAAASLGYGLIAAVALPRHAPRTAAAAAAEPAATDASEPSAPAQRPGGYGAVLADRRYVLFLFALVVNAVVYVQYVSALPVAMRAGGYATGWFSAVVALNGVIVITCELLVTKVVQRWPMRLVVMTGFVLLGAGMAAYALPIGVAAFVVGTLIWSFAEIVAGPTIFAYPAVASPEHLRGRYIGSANAMFGIGSASGSVLGLAVWDLVGKAVWPICGAVCGLGLLAASAGMRTVPAADAAVPGPVMPAEPPPEPAPAAGPVHPD
ncbi:MAG: MFS transporter [Frankiaceae bacterium]